MNQSWASFTDLFADADLRRGHSLEGFEDQAIEYDERVLQALRAENGPFVEGRELAVVVRGCLAELRRMVS